LEEEEIQESEQIEEPESHDSVLPAIDEDLLSFGSLPESATVNVNFIEKN
jgi:hypothetical protein